MPDIEEIEEVECAECKGVFFVPFYEDLPDIGAPSFCPFCGVRFLWREDV